MMLTRMIGILAVAVGVLTAQQPVEDPVMKARAQRAAAGTDQDLPPVPRTVMEPPPLPAPELHVKDTKGYKARRGKKGKKAVTPKKGGAKKATSGKKKGK